MTQPKAQVLRELLTLLQTQTIADSAVTDSTQSLVADGTIDSVTGTDYCRLCSQ